ncbi:MAG: prepilin peptidase [Spirochaetales bacterium]|nr:prepilin peptidase [Spirochaetales bacterium]
MFVDYSLFYQILYVFVVFFSGVGVFYYDVRYMRIPNWVNGLLFCAGLLLFLVFQYVFYSYYLLSFLYSLVFVILIKSFVKDKLGGGDVKYLIASSFGGLFVFNYMVLIASFLALVYCGIRGFGKMKNKAFPFGPFLCVGHLISSCLVFFL